METATVASAERPAGSKAVARRTWQPLVAFQVKLYGEVVSEPRNAPST